MSQKTRMTFVGLAVSTVLMPWMILLFGRGVFILCLLWLLIVSLLIGSFVMLRTNRPLALVGFAALLLTFFSMVVVPSLVKGK